MLKKTKYGKDISEFNTDKVSCDLFQSRVYVTLENGYHLRGSKVVCEQIE